MGLGILEFLDKSQGCKSLASLTDITRTHFELLGFPKWAYQAQLPSPLHKPETLLLHNFPKAWETAYVQQNFAALDPVITHGSAQPRPFQWSNLLNGQEISKSVKDYLGQAQEHGLADGFGVPVNSPTRRVAMVSFTTDGTAKANSRLFHARASELIALAFAFDTMARDLATQETHAKNGDVLTPREKECLLWTLQGKSAWEIGQIIGAAERTVVFHIENAKGKLNTTSKMHAVVKATIEGYIKP